jgi:hypothetical protein
MRTDKRDPEAVAERIRKLYEAEASERKLAVLASDIPFSYESITAEWLTNILCRNVPNAYVTEFSLDEPDEGTANRRRIFLKYNEAGDAAGLPSSVFCKATQGLRNRIHLGLAGGTHCEVTFYRNVRPHLDADIPYAFYANYDPESFNSIVVLNDMADRVEFCRHWTAINYEQASSQIDFLANLHSTFHSSAKWNARTLDLPTWEEFFANVESFGHEQATNNGFLAAESVIPPRLFRRFPEVWPATCYSVAAHRGLEHTLLHGDCHLKQWFIHANGKSMGVSDWQCTSFGHWARDVAYMVATSLAIEDRRRWERDLLKLYLELRAQKGAPVADAFDEAWLRYRQDLLSSLSWWTGTLTPTPDAPDMQPPDTSLEFIKRLAHAIDDLDALDACKV